MLSFTLWNSSPDSLFSMIEGVFSLIDLYLKAAADRCMNSGEMEELKHFISPEKFRPNGFVADQIKKGGLKNQKQLDFYCEAENVGGFI